MDGISDKILIFCGEHWWDDINYLIVFGDIPLMLISARGDTVNCDISVQIGHTGAHFIHSNHGIDSSDTHA